MKEKNKVGRPRLELEDIEFNGWDLLDSLIIWSAHQEYIAEELGISADTLDKRLKERYGCNFTEYRNKKKEKLRINIRKKQYDLAMKDNAAMLIWLGKNELGQSDKIEESTHLTGDAIKIIYDEYKKSDSSKSSEEIPNE